MPTRSTSAKLSKELASRILERAATFDAGDERVDLDTLRSAALDAGIKPDAFERALVESLAVSPPASEPQELVPRINWYEAVLKASIFGVAGGLFALAAVSLLVRHAPNDDAMLGALVGGVGAIAGVVTYFKGKLARLFD